MSEDAEYSADEPTDTESYLLQQAAAAHPEARAEPTDEEGGSAHPPGFHEPDESGYAKGDRARRERNPTREEA
jgi:hypothetical protein